MIRRDENSINIFHDKKNEAGYKRVLPGQFVIHLRSFQGGFAHSAIEGITSPAYTVFGFSEPEKHDSEYWKYVFTSKSFIQRLETVTYGIRDGRSISYEEFLTLGFVYPSKAEQTAIARYLDKLSDLITLHQRQHFLHSTPDISLSVRLIHPFYTSSWEQRKVSELFRVTRGYVLAATQTETEKTDEKPYPVYSSQTKDKGLMGYYKDYLYEDAITWTTDGANAGTVNYRAGKFYCTNVCGVLLSNEVKANQMIAEALINVAKGYVSYVGNPKLMNNVMADIVIQIPTHAEEREQLSSFFANLDNLITLHQRKCANLCSPSQVVFSLLFATSTFSWEQRKVSDLAEKTYGGGTPTTSNEAYWNGDIPWIQSSDVVDGKLLGVEPRKWITQDGLNNSAAQLIPGNSIAIITRVGVGKLAFMPYSYATSQDFLSLSKLNAEPLFTVYACYKKLQSELNAVQGTSIKGISIRIAMWRKRLSGVWISKESEPR